MPSHNTTNDGTVTDVCATSCKLEQLEVWNNDAAQRYLQIFNMAAASVTLGTTAAFVTLVLPPSGGNTLAKPIRFSQGCSYAVTTTRAGATGPTIDADVWGIYE